MAKARNGYQSGSPHRTVHVNLRELQLPVQLDDPYGLKPFAFDADTLSTLAAHLPKLAIKELWSLCATACRQPVYLGTDSKANAPTAIERQLSAAADLANALRTVLDSLRFGRAGQLLSRSVIPRALDDVSLQTDTWRGLADLSDRLVTFEGVALDVIGKANAIQRAKQDTQGRPRSSPVALVSWIGAIAAAHRLPLSKAAAAPFMTVCNCLWAALGIKTEATHAVRLFVGALKAGKVDFALPVGTSLRTRGREYRLRSDPNAPAGYRVTIIRDRFAVQADSAVVPR